MSGKIKYKDGDLNDNQSVTTEPCDAPGQS